MKYLCLGYHDEALWQAMSEGERNALLDETFAYADTLKAGGHVIDDYALQQAGTGATLRFEREKVSVTDGPFAETKEQLGGILLLEANDLNHAIRLMSKMPCMRMGGSLEIRPINEELKIVQTAAASAAIA